MSDDIITTQPAKTNPRMTYNALNPAPHPNDPPLTHQYFPNHFNINSHNYISNNNTSTSSINSNINNNNNNNSSNESLVNVSQPIRFLHNESDIE